MKVSAIEVQLSSGAIAITSFHFSRAWGVLGKSKAPTYCGSEIGLSQSEWILGRFWKLCRKARANLTVEGIGQPIEFVSPECNRLPLIPEDSIDRF